MPTKLVMLSWNDDSPIGPGNALPTPPMYPGNALPGAPAYPGNALPFPPAYPSHGLPGGPVLLPVFPFDPTIDNSLPNAPGRPDNSLPGGPSTMPIVPGGKFIVKYLACSGLILVPDNSLPPTAAPK